MVQVSVLVTVLASVLAKAMDPMELATEAASVLDQDTEDQAMEVDQVSVQDLAPVTAATKYSKTFARFH